MSLTDINTRDFFCKDVIGNVRSAQEDSHDFALKTPNGNIFVVCDGMGGHVGGKQASSIAVKSIIDYLKKERYPQPVQALNDALQFANMQILGYANEHPELKGMGTTACIVLLQDSEAYIAHVGDSRIYLYLGKEKQLHRITKDHSFVQTLVDTGQITDEEAEHHPNKNRILKALGIKADLAPSFDRVRPKNGDVFLICSDGLSGMVPDSTMRDVLMQNTSIEYKGETLIDLALDAGGLDNITLELIQIANSPHAKSVFRSYNPTRQKEKHSNDFTKPALICSIVLFIILFGFFSYPIGLRRSAMTVCEDNEELYSDSLKNVETILNTYEGRNEPFDNKHVDSLKNQSTKYKLLKKQWENEKRRIDSIFIYNPINWKYIKVQIKTNEENYNRQIH